MMKKISLSQVLLFVVMEKETTHKGVHNMMIFCIKRKKKSDANWGPEFFVVKTDGGLKMSLVFLIKGAAVQHLDYICII